MNLLSKTLKSFTAGLVLVFILGVTIISCGTSSEKSSDTTESAEGEHPTDEESEHPAEGDSTEHPED